MEPSTPLSPAIRAIGPCSVPGCGRPATCFVDLELASRRRVFGTVCDHCDLATGLAVFLLDLISS